MSRDMASLWWRVACRLLPGLAQRKQSHAALIYSPLICAHLYEPWATAKQMDRGVVNKVPNQNANPPVTAFIDLGGFNDLLTEMECARVSSHWTTAFTMQQLICSS